jgi:hypothetical protein
MNESEVTDIVTTDTPVQLGALVVDGPSAVIESATIIAKQLANIITERKLYSNIKGKNYVRAEGWTTMGGMLGVSPQEESVDYRVFDDGYSEYEATVKLVRISDDTVIGRASSIVGSDEPTWSSRPRYAQRSMAVTRATGKAFRLSFSWIMQLAGYEPTPAEEMMGIEDAEFVEEFVDVAPKPAKVTRGKKKDAFNPVVSLVEAGICENNHAGAALLNNHAPDDVKGDKDKLIAWGKLYRAWRDTGENTPEAVEYATQGIEPKE